jgi:hypothetical protein
MECLPNRVSSHSGLKSFISNTYKITHKCCIQRTYRKAKSFRCNTYENDG